MTTFNAMRVSDLHNHIDRCESVESLQWFLHQLVDLLEDMNCEIPPIV